MKNDNFKNEYFKKVVEKIAESIYHENILTSFIENLDEVIGERFQQATNLTQNVGNKIIESIDNTEIITKEIEEMSLKSEKEKNTLSTSNKNIISKLNRIGNNLDEVRNDVLESIQMISNALNNFDEVMEITKNINKIARKTNMLSINASIEAAKAKEHGRGFAVVAEEIQKLSTETNESAKMINDKITLLSNEISDVLDKINYISDLFNTVAEITEDSLEILEKNEIFLDKLIKDLHSNSTLLENNLGNLSISKDEMLELINTISTLNSVIKNVLNMQKNIKNIKI
ncbi:hypothetical protein X275_08115 [Marinitoga sp. 1197]|uniref:methyl-accepting chemotaxis protein n=1 Tax=Marinitoga sp. 1197 TaxID=1428449 RepID=UPI0006415747|nr:methyl-accepting chemotaxis protein [Marinitoga sp. 1197]KLO21852.1 hypothetical protein X275_08115 [Marinitoga sp. 1197]